MKKALFLLLILSLAFSAALAGSAGRLLIQPIAGLVWNAALGVKAIQYKVYQQNNPANLQIIQVPLDIAENKKARRKYIYDYFYGNAVATPTYVPLSTATATPTATPDFIDPQTPTPTN